MSPLWRDEVGIFLSPSCVVLNRMSRGLRPRCVADEFVPVESGAITSFAASLEALRAVLGNERWQSANARVVIADAWVRYAIVPCAPELRGTEERTAHAWHVLAQTFGEMAADWRLALSDQGPGRGQVASAMPKALLDELAAIAVSARLRVLSSQPQLVVAFNCWRHALPAAGGWFVSLDTGSLAAAHVSDDGWDQVRAVRIGSDWSAELRRLRTFGRLASAESAQPRVFVDAPFWVRKLAEGPGDGLEILQQDETPASTTLHMLVALKGLHA